MLEFFTYKRVLALAVLAVAYWVVLILYRVGKGGVVKRVDFWKSNWKIGLFWFVAVAIVAVVWYLLDKYGLVE